MGQVFLRPISPRAASPIWEIRERGVLWETSDISDKQWWQRPQAVPWRMKESNIILLAVVFYLSGLCHQVRAEVILGLSDSLHTHSQAAAECHVVPEVKAAASPWTRTRFPWSFPHEFLVLNIWLVCSELATAVLQCFHRLHWSCSSLPSLEESKLSGTRSSSVRSSGLL